MATCVVSGFMLKADGTPAVGVEVNFFGEAPLGVDTTTISREVTTVVTGSDGLYTATLVRKALVSVSCPQMRMNKFVVAVPDADAANMSDLIEASLQRTPDRPVASGYTSGVIPFSTELALLAADLADSTIAYAGDTKRFWFRADGAWSVQNAIGLPSGGSFDAGAVTFNPAESIADALNALNVAVPAIASTPSSAAPTTVDATASHVGTATTFARGDHAHFHGDLPGGALHSEATHTAAGFMSTAAYDAVAALPTELSNIDSDITTLEGDITTQAGEISSLQTLTGTHTTEIATVTGDLSTLSSTVASEINDLDSRVDTLEGYGGPANAAPPSVAASSVLGTSTQFAREDHTHAHGDQAGGTLHAVATTSVDGFFAHADKSKLDGVAAGATADAPYTSTPAAIGSAAAGSSGLWARGDHVHAHGNQVGGALHANAVSAGAAGFMTGADKQQLDWLGLTSYVSNVLTFNPVAPGDTYFFNNAIVRAYQYNLNGRVVLSSDAVHTFSFTDVSDGTKYVQLDLSTARTLVVRNIDGDPTIINIGTLLAELAVKVGGGRVAISESPAGAMQFTLSDLSTRIPIYASGLHLDASNVWESGGLNCQIMTASLALAFQSPAGSFVGFGTNKALNVLSDWSFGWLPTTTGNCTDPATPSDALLSRADTGAVAVSDRAGNSIGLSAIAPTSSASSGQAGQLAADASYVYRHDGTQWKRAPLIYSTF